VANNGGLYNVGGLLKGIAGIPRKLLGGISGGRGRPGLLRSVAGIPRNLLKGATDIPRNLSSGIFGGGRRRPGLQKRQAKTK
jgi:hypothetical protein